MRALLIGNADDLDPGFIGHRFRERGYAFTEAHREQPGDWPALDGFDLVLTLGSEWNVYRPELTAPLEAESALVRRAHDSGVPTFAICYGAQVLAHAFGGEVRRTSSPEIGWYCVESDRPDEVSPGPWMQWHYDVFTVPVGFDEIARNTVGPQAVLGGRTLATQFHPELTEAMIARWLRSGGAEQAIEFGLAPDILLAESRAAIEVSQPQAFGLVDWFCEGVVGGSSRHVGAEPSFDRLDGTA